MKTNNRCCHRPQRVEGLWSATPRRRAISIAASEYSTLVLTMPPTVSANADGEPSSLASLPVNTVYGWGHGNHSVMRVVFPSADLFDSSARRSGTSSANNNVYVRAGFVNPTAIACAKYHNVAITADGRVYTWGLHSESLGIEKNGPAAGRRARSGSKGELDWSTSEGGRRPRSNSFGNKNFGGGDGGGSNPSGLSSISSPQLVVGMLPESGGGCAASVSASESHTAVVTSDGHLFTWGTSHGNDVLGHKGVRWQPSPRRVKRVHGAVGVAAAREHTVLLVGTSFPPLPAYDCRSRDGQEENRPPSLQESAALEISRNVDAYNVVPVSLVAHRLNCGPLIKYCGEFISKNLDGVLAVCNKNDLALFLSSKRACLAGGMCDLDGDGVFHPFVHRLASDKDWVEGSKSLLDGYSGSIVAEQTRKKAGRRRLKKEQRPTESVLPGEEEPAVSNTKRGQECFTSTQVVKEKEASSDDKTGGTVKPSDEEPHMPRKLFPGKTGGKEGKASVEDAASAPKYHCPVCNVSCPDGDSYTLHMNGRRHRNRLAHTKAEEERQVAESMMAMKQMQLMERRSDDGDAGGGVGGAKVRPKTAWATDKSNNETAPATPKATDGSSTERKARSKSFQEILDEEQRQQRSSSINGLGTFASPVMAQPPAPRSSRKFPNASASLKSPPPPPSYSLSTSPAFNSSPGPSIPLSAFMKRSGGQKKPDAMNSVGASWGAKPPAGSSANVSWSPKPTQPKASLPTDRQHASASKTTKSFSQIQQEEEALRDNEDHMCRIDGNQWFVRQRERAASIGEIQEQERRDREMEELVEEQRRIEEEIMRNIKDKREEEDKAKRKKKKHDGSKKQQGRRQRGKNDKKSNTRTEQLEKKTEQSKKKKSPAPDSKK